MTLTIAPQEELDLVGQGLNRLIKEGVDTRRGEIVNILTQYPSLRKEKFDDAEFQQTVFESFKKHLDHMFQGPYYHGPHQNNNNTITGYCNGFPFLVKMTLEDEKIQKQFDAGAKSAIEGLIHGSEYGDDECSKYPDDRLSELFKLERFYTSPLITKAIKKYNVSGLLDAFGHWLLSRTEGPRLQRVYNLVKSAGAKKQDIGHVLHHVRQEKRQSYHGRKEVFNVNLLKYPEFPKEKINDEVTRKNIWSYRLTHIAEGSMEQIQGFVSAYPFITDTLKVAGNAIRKNNSEEYDENTKRLIQGVTQGLKRHLSYIGGYKEAEEINTYFTHIVPAIPRSEIVQGIYAGLQANAWHTRQDVVAEKKELLKKFPLSQEEAGVYIAAHPDLLPEILQYFPGYAFDDVYEQPKIKAGLLSRIPNANSEEIKFLQSATKISTKEIEDMHIQKFIAAIKNAVEEGQKDGYRMRSKKISESLHKLSEKCLDKANIKKQLHTAEIKMLLRQWAYLKICDNNSFNFADEFSHDDRIEVLCSNELFPLSSEEIYEEVFKVYLDYCQHGGVPYRSYKFLNAHIANKTPELVNAGVQGVVHLLDPSHFEHDWDIDPKLTHLCLFIRDLPFLKDELMKDTIQGAVTTLKKHFLSQGRIGHVKKLDHLDK